ncbi:N-acetyl-beta-hexosaminidase [Tritrichomonas foetus]|uniref:Beta-hexosaminidase n=1 Tax=Tritrichomonas foetus TaxID=1144522 RepID=A0A1J4L2N3_9EUKA|nr:N-acetyl-beta-hexosaminidase [Tritrichomonas foetus]|eukprot:OHT16206.1 N-acetyl-beta-hexosaminidase [Tritrichomonas foetus]
MENDIPSIIPLPVNLKIDEGSFVLTDDFTIFFDDQIENIEFIQKFIDEHLLVSTGFHYNKLNKNESQNATFQFIKDENLQKEHYHLQITQTSFLSKASTYHGHFYALQTFLQLLPPQVFSSKHIQNVEWKAKCVTIDDYPRFAWRGMHLDCSRHFTSLSDIKKYLVGMSIHKLNVFHWHLTDDQGWRFESKKYPLLNTISSQRIEKDGSKYGPFLYTISDMKEIVNFAKTLCITVVPEIEMPGHSCAVLAAYPDLGGDIGRPFNVENRWGIFEPTSCLGNPDTIQFFKDILLEVFEIFDSKFVHIGGDEVLPEHWMKCEKCIKNMESLQIPKNDFKKYHAHFCIEIAKFIKENGRLMIGWDEIMSEGELPNDNAIMAWNSAKTGKIAADKGYHVVMTPMECFYFDHKQFSNNDPYEYIGGMSPIDVVYAFNPTSQIDSKEKILGCQANCWTERMYSYRDIEWHVYPRICALCEVAWSPNEQKNFEQFSQRLEKVHLKRLEFLEINYAHQ